MSNRFRSADGYEQFDALMRRVEAGPTLKRATLPPYEPADVARRLAQQTVNVMARGYVAAAARRHGHDEDRPLFEDAVIECGGLSMRTCDGRVRPTVRLFLQQLGEGLLFWLHVLFTYLKAALAAGTGRGPATLLFGVGAADLRRGGSDGIFLDYCRRGVIAPLSGASRFIVLDIAQPVTVDAEQMSYARFPLNELALQNPLSPSRLIGFVGQHTRNLVHFVARLFRQPILVLLGRDVAYQAMAADLNDRGLIEAIVITSANMRSQPLWMSSLPARRFRTHLVFYSTNMLPIMWDGRTRQVNLPMSRHMRFDVAWVWNQWHADVVRSFGIDPEINIAGPIVWYVPATYPARDEKTFRIAVFDVTPVPDETARRLGLVDNYYSADTMAAFLADVAHACRQLEEQCGIRTVMLLKHKRRHTSLHDARYTSFVEKRIAQDPWLELIDPETDIFSLVAGTHVSVTIPFSSTAYVAEHMDRPAVFYDPTGKVWPNYSTAGSVVFVTGRAALSGWLAEQARGMGADPQSAGQTLTSGGARHG